VPGIFDEVEKVVPGIKGLAFADDIAWWAKGKDTEDLAAKLAVEAVASLD
jgi:hypothetical protein